MNGAMNEGEKNPANLAPMENENHYYFLLSVMLLGGANSYQP
jgi:hypothetical protein